VGYPVSIDYIYGLTSPTDLRRTIIAAGAITSHASSGVWFTISYATYFYQQAGIEKPFQTTILQNCLGLIGAMTGMFLCYKVLGRRPMLLIGSSGTCLCMLAIGLLGLAGHSHRAGQALVGFALMFNFFYNGFVGTITWPISGEVPSSRLRIYTVGLGTGINYFFNCKHWDELHMVCRGLIRIDRADLVLLAVLYQPYRAELGSKIREYRSLLFLAEVGLQALTKSAGIHLGRF
jgi:hypothetical protein